MFPVAALGGLGARVSAYFANVVRSNPRMVPMVVEKLRKGGVQIAASAEAIVDLVKKSPLNATLVVGTLASLGVSVVDAFSDPAQPEVNTHLANLQAAARPNTSLLAYAAVADESVSSTLKVDVKDVMALQAQSRVAVLWARGQFGSGRAAADALDNLEYLAAMPSEVRRFLLTETR